MLYLPQFNIFLWCLNTSLARSSFASGIASAIRAVLTALIRTQYTRFHRCATLYISALYATLFYTSQFSGYRKTFEEHRIKWPYIQFRYRRKLKDIRRQSALRKRESPSSFAPSCRLESRTMVGLRRYCASLSFALER